MVSELIDQPLLTVIPPHLHDGHNVGFARFIETETPTLLDKPLDLPSINKIGEEFNAIHY